MTRFSKCISEAVPEKELGHVLILTPFCVFVSVQSTTLTPTTGSSFEYLPRLPTLIPWPGPQVTLWTRISRVPSPMETQSSPVAIFVSIMFIPLDRPTWIPSVLGLPSGAMTITFWKVTFLQPNKLMWNCLLSNDVMSRINASVTKSNLMFWS